MDAPMYRNILIPLDGSELAERALPMAKAVAARSDGSITLLTVVGSTDERDRGAMAGERYLDRLLRDLSPPTSRVHVLTATGDPAEEILAAAGQTADLIAMTTRGRSGIVRGLLGSVTDRVVRSTNVPLLITRSESAPAVDDARIENIVCPLDGTALAEAALSHATAFARLFSAKVTLLHALGPFPQKILGERSDAGSDRLSDLEAIPDSDELIAAARAYVDRKRNELEDAHLSLDVRVELGQPRAEIVRLANDRPGSMIVMSTSGESGVKRWALGGVADGVIRTASVPTLVVRPSVG